MTDGVAGTLTFGACAVGTTDISAVPSGLRKNSPNAQEGTSGADARAYS